MRPIIRQIIIRPARIRPNGIYIIRAGAVQIDEACSFQGFRHGEGGVALGGEVLDYAWGCEGVVEGAAG
jgi:hypothetical protein